ncbi:MAG: uroporphyrinogen decarboxylase family protein [bacterium]
MSANKEIIARRKKRERIIATIEFKSSDRMPVRGGCGSETALAAITGRTDYQEHPKEVHAEAHKIWDVDLIHQFVLPDRLDRVCGPMAELDVSALRSCIGKMISGWKKVHGETAFKEPEGLRDFCAQLPEAKDAAKYVDKDKVYEQWISLDTWGDFLAPVVWIPGHLAGTCSWMWYTAVGYETYLMAHMLYPEAMERLFAFAGEEGRLKNEAITSAVREKDLIPLIYSGEDICDNRGPLCRPGVLKELYFPHLKRAIAPIVDAGIHWMWHSDGNILPILDDLLDCGIDGFQGFEEDKEMNLEKLLCRTCRNGKPPFICGSVSVTSTMYESPEAIRQDKQRMQDIFNTRGGVILAASSTIMDNTPIENVLELYKRNL